MTLGSAEIVLNKNNIRNIIVLTMFSVGQMISAAVHADTSPPRIIHEIISSEVAASRAYEFSATVTDDEAVAEVVLNYKHRDAEQFKSVPMKAQDGSADYTVTLPAADLVTPGIDYFISATDSAGNTQFRGFDFDPLQLAVFAPVALKGEGGEASGKMGNRKIWYVVGAVALVGLAASAGGGGGGSDSQNDTVNFVIEK